MAKLWWSVIGLVVVASVGAWVAVGGFSWTECDCSTEPTQASSRPEQKVSEPIKTTWYGDEQSELVEVIDLSNVYDPVRKLEPIDDFPAVIPQHPEAGHGSIMPYIGDTDEPPESEDSCWIGQVIGGFAWVQDWCKCDCPFRAPINTGCGPASSPPARMDTLEVREGDLQPRRNKPF